MLGFEGDGDDLADEAEDVVVVVGAVGVVDDAGAGIGGDAVLVDHSFEGGAVAEAVEYAVHEAGKLLWNAGDALKSFRTPAGTAYKLFAKAQPIETLEHQAAGDLDFWATWLARWLALCLPGDEGLQDEVLREISKRARLSARPY